MLEHPQITKALETGYPKDPKWPHCPVCGSECEEIYKNNDGDIFGCDECVKIQNAWEIRELYK